MSKRPTHQEIRDMVHTLRSEAASAGREFDAYEVVATLLQRELRPVCIFAATVDYAPDVASAARVRMSPINSKRSAVLRRKDRIGALSLIDGLREQVEALADHGPDDIWPHEVDWLLDEYDAVKFPNQVPEPRRKAALARLRRAGFLQEDK